MDRVDIPYGSRHDACVNTILRQLCREAAQCHTFKTLCQGCGKPWRPSVHFHVSHNVLQ